MSVRGNAAPRGMTAHDRIRLIGPFAECHQPRRDKPAGADHLHLRWGGRSLFARMGFDGFIEVRYTCSTYTTDLELSTGIRFVDFRAH